MNENPETFDDLTEEQLDKWTEEYIRLAEESIPYYRGDCDLDTDHPWAMPWTWGDNEFRTPADKIELDREELTRLAKEDFDFITVEVYRDFSNQFDREPTESEEKKLDEIAENIFWNQIECENSRGGLSGCIHWDVYEAFKEEED